MCPLRAESDGAIIAWKIAQGWPLVGASLRQRTGCKSCVAVRPSSERRHSEVRSESGRSACSSSRPFIPVVRARVSNDDGSAWLKKDDYGYVPQYLIQRQLQMAATYAQEQV